VGRAGGVIGLAGLVTWVATGHGSLWGLDRLGGAAIMLGVAVVIGSTIRLLLRRNRRPS
jgi:hypothetical protein